MLGNQNAPLALRAIATPNEGMSLKRTSSSKMGGSGPSGPGLI